jgi:hypothetical protein
MIIANTHHAIVNQDLVPDLVQLSIVDDVCGKAWNEVHITKCLVLAILPCKEDCAATLDPHYGAVTKLHGATHAGVEVAEHCTGARHVVGGYRVKDPLTGIPISAICEGSEDEFLHQLHMSNSRRHNSDHTC